MTARQMLTGWFFAAGLSVALACSSSQSPGGGRDGGLGGGSNGGGGSGGTQDARFSCGDASCSVGHDYCQDLASRGGNTGTGDPNTQHTVSCVPFGDCAAHDCSCVPPNCGYLGSGGACNQLDGGGTLGTCDQI